MFLCHWADCPHKHSLRDTGLKHISQMMFGVYSSIPFWTSAKGMSHFRGAFKEVCYFDSGSTEREAFIVVPNTLKNKKANAFDHFHFLGNIMVLVYLEAPSHSVLACKPPLWCFQGQRSGLPLNTNSVLSSL